MGSTTRKTWPNETPEEVIERVRSESGDAVADIVARALDATPGRRMPPRRRVGNKAKRRAAIPATPKKQRRPLADVIEERKFLWAQELERNAGRPGYNRSGLPSSGAPKADR